MSNSGEPLATAFRSNAEFGARARFLDAVARGSPLNGRLQKSSENAMERRFSLPFGQNVALPRRDALKTGLFSVLPIPD